MARNTLLRLTGDTQDAQRAVREVRQEVRRLGREEATARINVSAEGVEAQIERVRARLENLSKQEATPQVKIATARATEQLTRLELRLARLSLKSVTIDVDVKRGALERTAAGLGALERGVQGVGRGFANVFQQIPVLGGLFESAFSGAFTLAQNLGNALGGLVTRGISALAGSFSQLGPIAGPIGSAVGSVVSLGASLAGIAAIAGGLIIALNALIGAIVALAGALVALVASAAAAAAGLGALAVAFGAVLVPVVLVGIAAFQRFQAVLKARQARQQELAQAVQRHTAAENANRAAIERVRAANQAVAQAQDQRKQAEQRLAQTIVEGRRAEAQAAIDAKNAELALQDARLGIQAAKLNVLDAKKALEDLLKQAGVTDTGLTQLFKQFSDVHVDPSKLQSLLGAVGGAGGDTAKVDPLALAHAVLNLQQAQQGVKDAVNQTAQAERNLSEATKKRAQFTRQGVRAYAPYRQALRAVEQADNRVAQAEQRLEAAHRKLSRAQDGATAAQTKYHRALKALSQPERGFLGSLDGFIRKLTDFAKVVTGPIFAGLQRGLGSISKLFSDTGIRSAFGAVGKAIGDFFARLGRELTSRDWRSAFQQFANAGAQMIGRGGRGFTALLRILREIARAALPELKRIINDVSGALVRLSQRPGAIHRAVTSLVDQFRTWARFAGAVSRLVLALFRNAAPQGKSLAQSLTRIVNNWTKWINTHPGAVAKFFKDSVQRAKDIVGWIKDAVKWVGTHLPEAAKKAEKAFETLAHIIDQIPIIGKNKLEHAVDKVPGLESRINKDVARLHTHLSTDERQSTRNDLIQALKDLQKFVTLPGLLQNLLSRLQRATGHQAGGLVGGSGRGDIVPALLEPGEFVLRRGLVNQLGVPMLRALNGGAVPRVGRAGVAGGDLTVQFNVQGHPGAWVDERHLMEVAKMQLGSVLRAVESKV